MQVLLYLLNRIPSVTTGAGRALVPDETLSAMMVINKISLHNTEHVVIASGAKQSRRSPVLRDCFVVPSRQAGRDFSQ